MKWLARIKFVHASLAFSAVCWLWVAYAIGWHGKPDWPIAHQLQRNGARVCGTSVFSWGEVWSDCR